MNGQNNDQFVEGRLAAFRDNLKHAIGDVSPQEIAGRAGLDPAELAEVLHGSISGDLYMVSRLESVLGIPLWPRFHDVEPKVAD